MEFSVATVKLRSLSPYSQSKQHAEPAFEGETKDDYEKRTWQSKGHFSPETDCLVIPSTAIHQALVEAARYSKRQIPGQGKATWTAKFKAGISIQKDLDTGISRNDVKPVDISCDAQGRSGGGRVMRRFPQVPSWEAECEIWILDPIITEKVLEEMLEIAGMFVGIGRWRPGMAGGNNGRFKVESLAWEDNRPLKLAA